MKRLSIDRICSLYFRVRSNSLRVGDAECKPNALIGTNDSIIQNAHAEFTTGTHWHHQLKRHRVLLSRTEYRPGFPNLLSYNRSSFAAQSTYLIHGLGVTAGYEYEVENGFISYVGLHVRRNNQAGFLDARWQPITRLTSSARRTHRRQRQFWDAALRLVRGSRTRCAWPRAHLVTHASTPPTARHRGTEV